jgi:hypothetical protein
MCDSIYIVMCLSDSRRGFGLNIGFIDHFNKQLVITINYSATANFHIYSLLEGTLSLFQPVVSSPDVSW